VLSLVNAATVAADLVRRPGGAAASEVLLGALHAGPAELALIAENAGELDRSAGAARRERRADARRSLRAGGVPPVAAALDQLADELPGTPTTATVAALATATFTDGADLDALLTEDILSWARGTGDPAELRLWPDAVDAFRDALAVALAGPGLDTAAELDLLVEPVRAAGLPRGHRDLSPADLSPNGPEVLALLELAAGGTDFAAQAAHHRARPGWALAMHRASWAVYLSGRLRTAAAAQFALAGILARRPDRVELASCGAVAALSGAVHGAGVADLLDEASVERLTLHPTG
jgi:hypothetical protein